MQQSSEKCSEEDPPKHDAKNSTTEDEHVTVHDENTSYVQLDVVALLQKSRSQGAQRGANDSARNPSWQSTLQNFTDK